MTFAGASMTNMHAGLAQEAALQPLWPAQRRALPAPCTPVRRQHRALAARRSIRVHAEPSEDNTIVPAELSLVSFPPAAPPLGHLPRTVVFAGLTDSLCATLHFTVITMSYEYSTSPHNNPAAR